MKTMIYMDYAAATPMDPSVFAAMQPYFLDKFYNPSAPYLAAQDVKKDLDAARTRVAHWLGARPGEIIFTAGTTEANNLAIHGIMQAFPGANVVVSGIEHESVLMPAHQYICQEVLVQPSGIVEVDAIEAAVNDQTVLVSVMYANNELGTIQPIAHIGQMIAAIRKDRRQRGINTPLYLHTDAAQAATYLDIHAARLGVDLLSINGGKMYGPKQTGALFVRAGVVLAAQTLGGGQERGLRSGTENVAGSVGLSVALDLAQTRKHDELQRLRTLQQLFIKLLETAIPTALINGSIKHRLPNNVHLTIPGQDNERLLMALDEANIMCAAGSACSASNGEPSHVLRAIGLSDAEAQASLRFSMGHGTDEAAVRTTVAALARLV